MNYKPKKKNKKKSKIQIKLEEEKEEITNLANKVLEKQTQKKNEFVEMYIKAL